MLIISSKVVELIYILSRQYIDSKNEYCDICCGGGNDIFSSLAYININLLGKFNKIGLIGVLGFTPLHLCEGSNIEPELLRGGNIKRYVAGKEVYCNENKLIELLPDNVNHALVSTKYSAVVQANNLRTLFTEWGLSPNDTILRIIDYGGDILTDGNQPTIISPGLDAYTLAMVSCLNTYKSELYVCFPGVDGELDSGYLTQYCETYSISSEPIDESAWIYELTKVYECIKDTRPGNTIPILGTESKVQYRRRKSTS